MQPDTTFASASMREHLVRGALGMPLFAAAFVLLPWFAPWSLLLLVPSVALMRGCVSCWALGLGQTRAVCSLPDNESARAPALR